MNIVPARRFSSLLDQRSDEGQPGTRRSWFERCAQWLTIPERGTPYRRLAEALLVVWHSCTHRSVHECGARGLRVNEKEAISAVADMASDFYCFMRERWRTSRSTPATNNKTQPS